MDGRMLIRPTNNFYEGESTMQVKMTEAQKRLMGKDLLNNWVQARMDNEKAANESGLNISDIAGALGGERFVDDNVYFKLKKYLIKVVETGGGIPENNI